MPTTVGTHTHGGAVMRRTGMAEERHYWRPSRSFKNVDPLLPHLPFLVYLNGLWSSQWTCSQRFNATASAWVSHATAIFVYRITMQGSCLENKPSNMTVIQQDSPDVVHWHTSVYIFWTVTNTLDLQQLLRQQGGLSGSKRLDIPGLRARSPLWTISRRFKLTGSARVSHAPLIVFYELTIQGSYLENKLNNIACVERNSPSVVCQHSIIVHILT